MVLPFLVPVAATLAAELLPELVGRLGGKNAQKIAGEVVDAASSAAGVPASRDPSEILDRLRRDDRAQAEVRVRLAEIANREEERLLEDRRSARLRDLAFAQQGRRNGRADVMLILAFLALVACVSAVVWPQGEGRVLNTAEIGLITTVAGVLLKMVSDAFAFEFGSSQGSKDKDAQIARIQEQLATVSLERAAEAASEARAVEEAVAVATRQPAAVKPGAATMAPDGEPAMTFAERLRSGQI